MKSCFFKVKTVFICLILVFSFNGLFADWIHFVTGETEDTAQKWFGEVLSIENDSVKVRFTYKNDTAIHTIHVSRILSIYFDNNFQHTFPIRFKSIISTSVPSNLQELRRLYLFRHKENINEELPEVKIYGPRGNTSLKANIIKYHKESKIFIIKART